MAILSFEDHSGFDSPTGCGCIPTGGLIGKIFGGTKRRTDWDLSSGFRILLNRKLAETGVYEVKSCISALAKNLPRQTCKDKLLALVFKRY